MLNTGVSYFHTSKALALGHGDSARSNSSDRLAVIGWGAVDNERDTTKADGMAFVRIEKTAPEMMELNLKALGMACDNSEMLGVMWQIGELLLEK
jgi:hypothetical protein